MELAIFREYLQLSAPHLLDKTGVYVVQPNSLQRSLRNVHKIGKGQLRERFRMYKQMWPDGGKVFAFFTVPTPAAVWSTARDIPSLREQQLIGVGAGLLRKYRYHGEWIDANLQTIVRAMQQVHSASEGQFYICDDVAIHAVNTDRPASDAPAMVPRKVTPLRSAKVASTRAFFLSLTTQEKIELVKQLPRDERKVLWRSLSSDEKTQNLTHFIVAGVNARPEWLPASYAAVV